MSQKKVFDLKYCEFQVQRMKKFRDWKMHKEKK